MGKILFIDTSRKFSSILLFDQSVVLGQRNSTELNTHAQTINVHIEEILNETHTNWKEIAAIAVMNGPGSYTGLRIGLSSAKGFCYAHDIPLLLFNRFQLMHYTQNGNSARGYLIFARENEYFFQSYADSGKESSAPEILSVNEIMTLKRENALTLFTDEETTLPLFDKVRLIQLSPLEIKNLVCSHFSQNKFADLMNCEPFYLKNVHINKINKL